MYCISILVVRFIVVSCDESFPESSRKYAVKLTDECNNFILWKDKNFNYGHPVV